MEHLKKRRKKREQRRLKGHGEDQPGRLRVSIYDEVLFDDVMDVDHGWEKGCL